jgi:ferric-dicitrate binding protein FerR (iron transport regulator)
MAHALKNMICLLAALAVAGPLRAEDSDLRFEVVDVGGRVTAYGDKIAAKYRLKKGHKLDEGDRITTGPKSEAVLALKGKAYLHLGPNTQVRISRLDVPEFKARCQINLVSGRVFVRLDPKSAPNFLVSSGDVLCRAHGTLFEISRRKGLLWIASHEGSVTANVKARPWIANAGQVLKFDGNRFRYKRHNLEAGEKERLAEFKDHLEGLKDPRKRAEPLAPSPKAD